MVILDTCVLLWLADRQECISDPARSIIRQQAGALHISAISAFEIAVKFHSKKLSLPLPPLDWFKRAVKLHGLHEIPVTSELAAFSAGLNKRHNDPCDRIIIASAIKFNCPVISPDRIFAEYPDVQTIW